MNGILYFCEKRVSELWRRFGQSKSCLVIIAIVNIIIYNLCVMRITATDSAPNIITPTTTFFFITVPFIFLI